MAKKYAIIEIKTGDCIFRQYDTFEYAYFCNKEKVWLENKKECIGCKCKDSGETREEMSKKIKCAIERKQVVPFSATEITEAILDFIGVK